MSRERCHRCHAILTSEDKHWYGVSCEECEQDYRYEEWERHWAVKSAYWRWRAVCFGVRWLRFGTAAVLGICLRPVLRWLDGKREQSNARRQ
ncbi:hypothetical protein ABNP39_08130 [Pantoea dispersa]